eukprot:GHVP01056217.1.p2 GENE.GHVP01056217.1~~GHVP01056217.1.p2  ORF type:complete len:140 (-),score=18.83 GHVP01056217.1:1145-1564(-)
MDLNHKAYLLLSKILFDKENKTKTLIIRAYEFDIDTGELNGMEKINFGNLEYLEVEMDAYNILPKIDFSDSSKIDFLSIIPKNSYIDRKIIEEMGTIRVHSINNIILHRQATLLLQIITLLDGHTVRNWEYIRTYNWAN